MIANTAFLAAVTTFLIVAWLAGELSYLSAYKTALFKTHGIKTSRSAVQRFCAKIGIRPYRPTYRFLRGDPAKQAAAKEDLADLKKKRGRASWCC